MEVTFLVSVDATLIRCAGTGINLQGGFGRKGLLGSSVGEAGRQI